MHPAEEEEEEESSVVVVVHLILPLFFSLPSFFYFIHFRFTDVAFTNERAYARTSSLTTPLLLFDSGRELAAQHLQYT